MPILAPFTRIPRCAYIVLYADSVPLHTYMALNRERARSLVFISRYVSQPATCMQPSGAGRGTGTDKRRLPAGTSQVYHSTGAMR